MPRPTIIIDKKLCTVPFDCKKCLQICPQDVFQVHAVKVVRGAETDPKEPKAYDLDAFYIDKCTGCDLCAELCPVQAIKIVYPAETKA